MFAVSDYSQYGSGPVQPQPPNMSLVFIAIIVFALAGFGGFWLMSRPDPDPVPSIETTFEPPTTLPPSPPIEFPVSPATTAARQSVLRQFGDTYAWENGLTITVAKPKKFTPNTMRNGPKGLTAVKFKIKLTNASNETMSTDWFSASVISGGKAGEAIHFDRDNDFTIPRVKIPVGKSLTFTLAFYIANTTEVSITTTAKHDSEVVTFST